MDQLPDMKQFEACLNGQFDVTLADGSIYSLTLTEVKALAPTRAPGARPDPFELKFHGPGPGYLPQQIHQLSNDVLRPFPLFLVPIGQDANGFVYQAIFN